MKKISVLIQTRTGSSRLPNKVLKTIEGKPAIWHVINRVKQIESVEQIALITTKKPEDKILLKIAEENGIIGFAGNELDVLDRHFQCAEEIKSDPIIRITSDCPLIDPFLSEKILQYYLSNDFDYVSNTITPTFPDGLDTEIFSYEALEKASYEAKLPSEREHVTPYFIKHPEKFKISNYVNDYDLSNLRWTLDQGQDLTFIQEIYSRMKPKTIFSMNEILNILSSNPELLEINKGIQRNEGHKPSLEKDKELLAKK